LERKIATSTTIAEEQANFIQNQLDIIQNLEARYDNQSNHI
jgi:hypothetical protein